MASRFDVAIEATERALHRSRPMRMWLESLRWCGNAIRRTADVAVKDRVLLAESGTEVIVLFLLSATDPDAGARPIHLPLSIASARFDPSAFELKANGGTSYVMEAERRESYARFMIDAFRRGARIRTESGDLLTFRGDGIDAVRKVTPIPMGDTSNIVLHITTTSGEIVLKSYKLLDPGNREPDIFARLRGRNFPHIARFLGEFLLGAKDDRLVLGMVMEHVDAVDLFTWMRDGWRRALSSTDSSSDGVEEGSRRIASELGEATAALHDALIDGHPGPWQTEVFTEEDFRVAFKAATHSLGAALRRLGQIARDGETRLGESARGSRTELLDLRMPIEETLRHLEANVGGVKSVIHSDLHLAQVLRQNPNGKLLFIDFEGEPARAPGARDRKLPPLRDVGSMVRSFAYVRHYAMRDFVEKASGSVGSPLKGDDLSVPQRTALGRLIAWEQEMVERFTGAYLSRTDLYPGLSQTEVGRLVRGWALEKALYELDYELTHRVENFPIPFEGIATLASSGHARG